MYSSYTRAFYVSPQSKETSSVHILEITILNHSGTKSTDIKYCRKSGATAKYPILSLQGQIFDTAVPIDTSL
jgi:hypothetical protein